MADNLLDKASILLTPTAYDNGSMLSVKPNENLYGSELVTNGDFSNGSANWTLGTGMSIINEELHITNNSTNDRVYQNIGLVQGKIYQVSFDVLSFSGTSFQILMGGTSTPDIGVINSTGSYTFTQECLGSNGFFYFMSTLSNVVIDNVSVVEDLSGDFQFSRSSAATRVNAQGLVENVQIISSELVSNGNFSQIGTEEVLNGNFSQEGSELVTNGDFATDSDWSKDSGWSIENGQAICNGVGINSLQQSGITTVGKIYKLSFDVLDCNDFDFLIISTNFGDTYVDADLNSSVVLGRNTFYIKPTNGTGIRFRVANGTTLSIDNVSVKEVGQNWDTYASGSSTVTFEEEAVLDIDGSNSNVGVYQQNVFANGTNYKIVVNMKATSSFDAEILETQGASTIDTIGSVSLTTSYQDFTFYHQGTGTNDLFIHRLSSASGSNQKIYIKSASVKEVGQDWTFSSGAIFTSLGAKITHTPTAGSIAQPSVLVVGKNYKITYEITEKVSGSLKMNSAVDASMVTTVGTHTKFFEADLTTLSISRTDASNNDVTITNISVKEITDDTNIPRINYEGFSYQDSLGSELVVNGNFSNGLTNWTNNSSWWSIVNGEAYHPASTSMKPLSQSVSTEVGKEYKISVNVNIVSGTPQVFWDKVSGQEAQSLSQGLNEVIVTTFKTNSAIYFGRVPSTNTEFYIDNVSVKEYLGQEVVPDSGCGSWLLEPQSTNLITYSEDFSQWTKAANVILSNGFNSPSMLNTAYAIEHNGTTAEYWINKSITLPSANITVSAYLKKGTKNWVVFRVGNICLQYFDIENEVLGNNIFGAPISYNFVDAGNDWVRLDMTVLGDGGNNTIAIYSAESGLSGQTTGTNGDLLLYIWGAQVEQQSYATSYIPTNGATNTRLQDIANNSGNSSLINSTEGVLYAEIASLSNIVTSNYISLSDGTYSNRISILYSTGTNIIRAFLRLGGAVQADMTFTVSDITEFHKVAFKFKENDFALWIDGAEVRTDTSGSTMPSGTLSKLSFSEINTAGGLFRGKTKALAVFPILTDVELQSLTTQ